MEETPTQQELSLQATEGLSEIEGLIAPGTSHRTARCMLHPEAAEVAKANKEALTAFQEATSIARKAPRKKPVSTVTFEELSLETNTIEIISTGAEDDAPPSETPS